MDRHTKGGSYKIYLSHKYLLSSCNEPGSVLNQAISNKQKGQGFRLHGS